MEEVKLVPQTIIEPGKEKAAAPKKNTHRNHYLMALLGSCGVVAWIIFFSLGMLIDSSKYRIPLLTRFSWSQFIMTVITYTPTNIAILCIVSAFTGGCASLLAISKAEKVMGLDKANTKTSSHVYMSESPFSSMLRGIVIFFAFLAGVVVTSSNAFSDPTPGAYTQAAGLVSLLSFIVGYDPTMFRSWINIADKIKAGN